MYSNMSESVLYGNLLLHMYIQKDIATVQNVWQYYIFLNIGLSLEGDPSLMLSKQHLMIPKNNTHTLTPTHTHLHTPTHTYRHLHTHLHTQTYLFDAHSLLKVTRKHLLTIFSNSEASASELLKIVKKSFFDITWCRAWWCIACWCRACWCRECWCRAWWCCAWWCRAWWCFQEASNDTLWCQRHTMVLSIKRGPSVNVNNVILNTYIHLYACVCGVCVWCVCSLCFIHRHFNGTIIVNNYKRVDSVIRHVSYFYDREIILIDVLYKITMLTRCSHDAHTMHTLCTHYAHTISEDFKNYFFQTTTIVLFQPLRRIANLLKFLTYYSSLQNY